LQVPLRPIEFATTDCEIVISSKTPPQ